MKLKKLLFLLTCLFLAQRLTTLLKLERVRESLLSSRKTIKKTDTRQGPLPSNFKRPHLSQAWCYQGLPPNPHLSLEKKKNPWTGSIFNSLAVSEAQTHAV